MCLIFSPLIKQAMDQLQISEKPNVTYSDKLSLWPLRLADYLGNQFNAKLPNIGLAQAWLKNGTLSKILKDTGLPSILTMAGSAYSYFYIDGRIVPAPCESASWMHCGLMLVK
jgi:hypothetical protein